MSTPPSDSRLREDANYPLPQIVYSSHVYIENIHRRHHEGVGLVLSS